MSEKRRTRGGYQGSAPKQIPVRPKGPAASVNPAHSGLAGLLHRAKAWEDEWGDRPMLIALKPSEVYAFLKGAAE